MLDILYEQACENQRHSEHEAQVQEAFWAYIEELGITSLEENNKVFELFSECVEQAQRQCFKDGFRVALNLLAEGRNTGNDKCI